MRTRKKKGMKVRADSRGKARGERDRARGEQIYREREGSRVGTSCEALSKPNESEASPGPPDTMKPHFHLA